MKARPVIFSGPMLRALLDGRKTQTRRVVKPQPYEKAQGRNTGGWYWEPAGLHNYYDGLQRFMPPYCPYGQPGDLLWVRETWRQAYAETSYSRGIIYRADRTKALGMDEYSDRHKWRPSIHMPRWASRLTLYLTDVRVEWVQEITEDDARAEGLETEEFLEYNDWQYSVAPPDVPCKYRTLRSDFERLWDSLNAKRGFAWHDNPWVWVLAFRVIHSSVDQVISYPEVCIPKRHEVVA